MRAAVLARWIVLLPLAGSACAKQLEFDLPHANVSQAACAPATGRFMAGFAKIDITPPPGPGLQGYGPDGRIARGHRVRLYARALVLQDSLGTRVALLVTDLPQVSAILHRETVRAGRLPDSLCLGANRLLLAATHTHAGPGNFFLSQVVNQGGSPRAGYDTLMVDFLADRFALALTDAVRNLRPAVAAWGTSQLWGVTRNRSLEAFLRNRPNPLRAAPSPQARHLPARYQAVDPTLTLLRVDTLVSRGGSVDTVPAGAFSVFAIHGTGNAVVNDLFDAGIHGLVERAVERAIDSIAGYQPEYGPRSVHLFANGTEGDVSPDWPEGRLCPRATLRPVRAPAGPRVPRPPVRWDYGSDELRRHCLFESRAYVNEVGAEIGARAVELFRRLEDDLRGALAVSSSFRTLRLWRNPTLGICAEPAAGSATLGGAEDGRTRYYRWKVLGLAPTGFEEAGTSRSETPRGCHERKRLIGGVFVSKLAAGPDGYPRYAQPMVVRVGDGIVGAVPWEVTTVAGRRILASMREGAASAGAEPATAVLVSLANGYLQYVTTAEEYDFQHYEGASNLYGPGTARMIATQLGSLTRDAYSGSAGTADLIRARPGSQVAVLPQPDSDRVPARRFLRRVTRGDRAAVTWIDAPPGQFRPHLGPVIRVESRATAGAPWELVTWDDSPELEVRAMRDRGGEGYEWRARWSACQPGREYRFVLPARDLLRQGASPVRMPPVEPPPSQHFGC